MSLGKRKNRVPADMSGQVFGMLTVKGFDETSPKGQYKWICECECGRVVSKHRSDLKKNKHHNCGCISKELRSLAKRPDYVGKRFGSLTVISWDSSVNYKNKWLCKCDCGNITKKLTASLKDDSSCGCMNNLKTHGMSKTRPYSIWTAMKSRCNNEDDKHYEYYGGRGITYDPKWETFEGFWEDMAEGYLDDLTLDRIDPFGNYCKENCRWANRSEQSYNTRMQKNNTSGRTGVVQDKRDGRYYARIDFKGKTINLGSSLIFEEAVRLRENAEIKYFGYNKD